VKSGLERRSSEIAAFSYMLQTVYARDMSRQKVSSVSVKVRIL
jgi:hypothetical protein